jgi:exoribonuclease R
VCLAVTAGAAVPEWLRAALPTLPGTMAASDAVAGAVGRACVDRTEAALLADRVGAEFDVVVLRASTDSAPGEVYLHAPPVLARCTGALRLGETARVRLVEADPVTGRIAFTTVG